MQTWEGIDEFLREIAEEDLRQAGEIRPCLVAFRGSTPLLMACLRPFAAGAYAEPMIELLALAAPPAADRLALSMTGRAWSLDDPVEPVLPEADLRQRVLSVQGVDGSSSPSEPFAVLWPFEFAASGALSWGEALRDGGVEGWIPQALATAVEARGRLAATAEDVARQAARCAWLGHEIYLAPAAEELLAAAR